MNIWIWVDQKKSAPLIASQGKPQSLAGLVVVAAAAVVAVVGVVVRNG